MNLPDTPLEWPGDFPPTDPWKKFFYGIRWLGPDTSFFKYLCDQQAARTEMTMGAWPDQRQRQIALQFGECISANLGWKTPYFIPADRAVVVAYGPKFLDFDDFLFEAATRDYEQCTGRQMKKRFWEDAVDWQDKNAYFGELVRKLADELDTAPKIIKFPQPSPHNRIVQAVRQ